MSRRPLPLVLVLAGLVSLVGALALSACQPRPSVAELDRKVFATSLPSFDRWWRSEQAAAHHVSLSTINRWLDSAPGRLDDGAARARPWDLSTDLCSQSPDRGPVFDFRRPCIRHDFAWRNLRRLHASTHDRRLAASHQFLHDLLGTCDARPVVQRVACRGFASAYGVAVIAAS